MLIDCVFVCEFENPKFILFMFELPFCQCDRCPRSSGKQRISFFGRQNRLGCRANTIGSYFRDTRPDRAGTRNVLRCRNSIYYVFVIKGIS